MTIRSAEHVAKGELKKINVRLWTADVDYLRARFPDNYNAQIRRIIDFWIQDHRRSEDNAETQS